MGSVYRKGRGIWGKWRDAEGTQRYYNAGTISPDLTKREAAAREAKLRKEARAMVDLEEAKKRGLPLAIESPPKPRSKAPTLGSVILAWAEHKAAARDSSGNPLWGGGMDKLSKIRCHVIPILGHKRIDKITQGDVKHMIDLCFTGHHGKKGLAGSSVEGVRWALSAFYQDQIAAKIVAVNPCRGLDRGVSRMINKSKPNPKLSPFLSKRDQEAIYWALPEHIRPAFLMGCQAGLRQGEILALRWGDLDFKRSTIRVAGQRGVVGADGQRTIKPVKDGEGRLQPMTPTLAAAMKEWKLQLGPGFQFCFPARVDRQWCNFDRPKDSQRCAAALTEAEIKAALKAAPQRKHGPQAKGKFQGNRRGAAKILGVGTAALRKRIAELENRAYRDARRPKRFTPEYEDRMMHHTTLTRHLDRAFASTGIKRLCWKNATRHTYGSNFIADGGQLVELRDIMGHCNVTVTERYALNRPDHFSEIARSAGVIELSKPKVIKFKRKRG
jgi:integrase